MGKRWRWWIIIGVVVICATAGWYWMKQRSGVAVSYRLDQVDRGDITVEISATGTLNAVTTVQVGSQISGTISQLYADFNSVVKEGQLLAQIDSTFLHATVTEQSANVDRAKAELNEAKRNSDRTYRLFASSLVSQADMDVATTALESAEASLKQAEASLERSLVNLKYTTVRAPISGVVISRNVDVGQTVAASLQAPTLFAIANDLRQMQVEASIDEADIGSVQQGQEVKFRVDAYPEEEFEGEVSQIRLAPIINQNVVTYSVIIAVANPEKKLMPGMTATVSVEVAHKENVLRVPLQALRFTPASQSTTANAGSALRETPRQPQQRGAGSPGAENPHSRNVNQVTVWVLSQGNPAPVTIIKGIQNTRYVEAVSSELKEGDKVIIGTTSNQTSSAPAGQNPFMPRMPGGGGRGH